MSVEHEALIPDGYAHIPAVVQWADDDERALLVGLCGTLLTPDEADRSLPYCAGCMLQKRHGAPMLRRVADTIAMEGTNDMYNMNGHREPTLASNVDALTAAMRRGSRKAKVTQGVGFAAFVGGIAAWSPRVAALIGGVCLLVWAILAEAFMRALADAFCRLGVDAAVRDRVDHTEALHRDLNGGG